jgi:hypothetical protein
VHASPSGEIISNVSSSCIPVLFSFLHFIVGDYELVADVRAHISTLENEIIGK